ncbi:hypothetical protein FRC10_003531 [Ceratobasidium sp. 414]|nr:hypothetical protein FRC10_003531 [Ceratobasidium sp. 414]
MKTLALALTLALATAPVAVLHPGATRLRSYPESTKRNSVPPLLRSRAESVLPHAAAGTLKPSNFFVNSSALPLITFLLQNSYAGRLPISSSKDETKEMFFWYWTTSAPGGSNKPTIWLTGGPGCSSLMGFSTQNGPIWLHPNTTEPTYNEYNWATASDMPIGTGFNLGTPNITNESQLAN